MKVDKKQFIEIAQGCACFICKINFDARALCIRSKAIVQKGVEDVSRKLVQMINV